MKRNYVPRKYNGGIGEPLAYDRDGQLQDRPLTQASAREMVAEMQSLVPALAKQPIEVVMSRDSYEGKAGEYWPETHTIYLYDGGHSEGVLLHEMAHVTVPVILGSTERHIIHGAGFKATLIKYEKVWRKCKKLRGHRIVKPVPQPAPHEASQRTWAGRDAAPIVVARPYRPLRPESRLHRLIRWVVRMCGG